MENKNVKVFEYEGYKITFEFENGQRMVNATQMAKAFGKRVAHFLQNKQTKEFINFLNSRYRNSGHGSNYEALRVVKGGSPGRQGTWMDEKLALKFAAWLSVEFEAWVYDTIHDILSDDRKTYEFFLQKLEDQSRDNLYIAKLLKEKLKL